MLSYSINVRVKCAHPMHQNKNQKKMQRTNKKNVLYYHRSSFRKHENHSKTTETMYYSLSNFKLLRCGLLYMSSRIKFNCLFKVTVQFFYAISFYCGGNKWNCIFSILMIVGLFCCSSFYWVNRRVNEQTNELTNENDNNNGIEHALFTLYLPF